MKATYSKSKKEDGKWMVRVVTEDPFEDLPAEGSEVTITKKSGETSVRTVTKLVWQGDDEGATVGLYALD